MAKIAVESKAVLGRRAGSEQFTPPHSHLLYRGHGWSVRDVVCTAGPHDRPFEEQHSQTSIAVVLSGTFQYRTTTGHELMSAGSLLLGNRGDSYACGHEHGAGDRCVSFHYSDEVCDDLPRGAQRRRFSIPRIPAIRELSHLAAQVAMITRGWADPSILHEIALQVIDRAIRLQDGLSAPGRAPEPSSVARVTRVLRRMEADPAATHALPELAAEARLSPYHFLRCFEALTSDTPHQYLRRLRLRRAAIRLQEDTARILDIALDSGFGDVSNFNRAFRAEFGRNPRAYRQAAF